MPNDLTWTNEKRKLSDLIPWPRNPRQIREHQARRLSESLDEFGQVDIIAIGPGGEVYNGHQRLNVWAQEHGPKFEVDVRVSSRELTEKEREKLVVFLHKGAAGEFDFDTLANEFELDELLEWGFEERDLELDLWHREPPEDPGPQIDRAEELQEKWQVQRGQVWQVGRHRLMCGDSTNAKDVGRLMGEKEARALIADPPYGMNLDTDYSKMPSTKLEGNKTYSPVFGDDASFDYGSMPRSGCDEEFWFGADYYVRTLPGCGSWLVWDKRVDEQFDAMFGSAFELIWSKVRHKREIIRCNNTLFSGEVEARGKVHPTTKPTKVILWIIERYSGLDDIITDWFVGSGTTLIVCQQTGRIGYGMEIEPKYCAVTLERLAGMGLEAQLLE